MTFEEAQIAALKAEVKKLNEKLEKQNIEIINLELKIQLLEDATNR